MPISEMRQRRGMSCRATVNPPKKGNRTRQQMPVATDRITSASAAPAASEKDLMIAGATPQTRTVKPSARSGRYLLSGFTRQNFFHGGTLGHAVAVVENFRKTLGIHAVGFKPFGEGEKIGVGNSIVRAHHPWPFEIFALDEVEA